MLWSSLVCCSVLESYGGGSCAAACCFADVFVCAMHCHLHYDLWAVNECVLCLITHSAKPVALHLNLSDSHIAQLMRCHLRSAMTHKADQGTTGVVFRRFTWSCMLCCSFHTKISQYHSDWSHNAACYSMAGSCGQSCVEHVLLCWAVVARLIDLVANTQALNRSCSHDHYAAARTIKGMAWSSLISPLLQWSVQSDIQTDQYNISLSKMLSSWTNTWQVAAHVQSLYSMCTMLLYKAACCS